MYVFVQYFFPYFSPQKMSGKSVRNLISERSFLRSTGKMDKNTEKIQKDFFSVFLDGRSVYLN